MGAACRNPGGGRFPLCSVSRPSDGTDACSATCQSPTIRPLSRGRLCDDSNAFGVKAANVAVLRTLGLSRMGTVPDGFAIPFYFYDEFMKHNGFYDRHRRRMLADTGSFQDELRHPGGSELKEAAQGLSRMRIRPSGYIKALVRDEYEKFPAWTINSKLPLQHQQ